MTPYVTNISESCIQPNLYLGRAKPLSKLRQSSLRGRKEGCRPVHPSAHMKAPSNWGTATHGKLSTNNWRVIGAIHLPIT